MKFSKTKALPNLQGGTRQCRIRYVDLKSNSKTSEASNW